MASARLTTRAKLAITLLGALGSFAFAQDAFVIAPEVTAALEQGEPVSVIVALAPEKGGRNVSTAEIASLQDEVLASLSADEFELSVRYSHIPALSGRLYLAGVDKLASNQRVRRVGLDTGGGGSGESQ